MAYTPICCKLFTLCLQRALGQTRTGDLPLRRRLLYPLSYGGELLPKERVTDGTRTRNILGHNQTLCQLNYRHHAERAVEDFIISGD